MAAIANSTHANRSFMMFAICTDPRKLTWNQKNHPFEKEKSSSKPSFFWVPSWFSRGVDGFLPNQLKCQVLNASKWCGGNDATEPSKKNRGVFAFVLNWLLMASSGAILWQPPVPMASAQCWWDCVGEIVEIT